MTHTRIVVPANAVFRAGNYVFTDEGEHDGIRFVGVYDVGGSEIEFLPLAEARTRYLAQFDAVRAYLLPERAKASPDR